MASILGIDTIQHQSGTTAMTIDSTGRVLTPSRPAFSVFNTSSVTISGLTALVFDTATFNIGYHFELSTGKFTAPITGI